MDDATRYNLWVLIVDRTTNVADETRQGVSFRYPVRAGRAANAAIPHVQDAAGQINSILANALNVGNYRSDFSIMAFK